MIEDVKSMMVSKIRRFFIRGPQKVFEIITRTMLYSLARTHSLLLVFLPVVVGGERRHFFPFFRRGAGALRGGVVGGKQSDSYLSTTPSAEAAATPPIQERS